MSPNVDSTYFKMNRFHCKQQSRYVGQVIHRHLEFAFSVHGDSTWTCRASFKVLNALRCCISRMVCQRDGLAEADLQNY